jgi:intracellular sulfur oxidation DsrE/DsrF family protein
MSSKISANPLRRRWLSLALIAPIAAIATRARAQHTETHFDDKVAHRLVYQCNKADDDYIGHILFSAGEMVRKYGDDIEVVIAAFGPGLHLLGKRPGRRIDPLHQTRVQSLSVYGVSFHACGNTMKSLNWQAADLLDMAVVVPVGIDDIMQLQEQGFSYISM